MPERDEPRNELLLRMYDQLWGNINRHILSVWQSLTAVIAGFALFGLTAQKVINLDVAVCLFVLLDLWLIGHVIDASAWFNRNLHIIGNIESELLLEEDSAVIHPFFAAARRPSMLEQFRLQWLLAVSAGIVVMAAHFVESLGPDLAGDSPGIAPIRVVPYLLIIVGGIGLISFWRHHRRHHERLLLRSPGRYRRPSGESAEGNAARSD